MAVDWTQVLVALAVGLPATIVAAGTLLQGLRTARKLAENTELTKVSSEQATLNAQVAASAATDAKATTEHLAESIHRQLNGDLDKRIKDAVDAGVKTVLDALAAHTAQDEQNMLDIRNFMIDKKND